MSNGSEHTPERAGIPYETDEGVVVAVDLDGTVHRMKPDEDAEKAWNGYAETAEFIAPSHGGIAYRVFMAGRASRWSRIAALEAENDKLNKAARAAVRRLEKAAQYCGDPQHPIWDGDRTSAEARRRVDGLVDILDPFRPELEDASDEDWDRIYKLDPIDAYVSDYEERMEARAVAAEAERDALQSRLDSMTTEWGVGWGNRGPLIADSEATARKAASWHTKVFRRLVGPWVEVEDK